jgi:hypothetical protein
VLDHTPQRDHALARMVNLGLLTDIEVDRFLDLTRQPGFGYLPLPMVTTSEQLPGSRYRLAGLPAGTDVS